MFDTFECGAVAAGWDELSVAGTKEKQALIIFKDGHWNYAEMYETKTTNGYSKRSVVEFVKRPINTIE